ncbi:MAG: hypothetical protein EZS28_021511, partial [Streblomastix strix]
KDSSASNRAEDASVGDSVEMKMNGSK